MRIRLLGLCLIAILIVGSLLAGCTQAPKEQVILEAYSCSATGTNFQFAVAISDLLEKNHPWLRLAPIETLGGTDNVLRVNKLPPERKKTALSLSSSTSYYASWDGLETIFDAPNHDLRLIATLVSGTGQPWVTFDPNIKTPQDFIGKRLAIGAKRGTGVALNSETMLDVWGIKDQVEMNFMGYSDCVNALMDGTVDISNSYLIKTTSGVDWASPFKPLGSAGKPVYLIGFQNDNEIQQAQEQLGDILAVTTIPPGEIGDQTEPLLLGAVTTAMVIGWDVTPDDTVTELCEFLVENIDRFAEYVPGSGNWLAEQGPEFYSKGMPLRSIEQVHPAAVKYYNKQKWQIGIKKVN